MSTARLHSASRPHAWVILLLVISTAWWTGCETLEVDPFTPEVVVESYQIAEKPMGEVRLSRSVDINERFVFEEQAISGADVVIHRLDDDGAVMHTYRLLEDTPGVYRVEEENEPAVEPLTRYRLEASIPETGEEISSETLVPGSFELLSVSADTATFRDVQPTLSLTRSSYPDRQAVYVFSTEAIDLAEENLTPFYRGIFDNNGNLEDLRIANSGLLNEANFPLAGDGTVNIDLPWIAIAFYGLNRIFVSAVDDNYFDFVRSQDAQQGGPGFSPGEIPNVLDNVDGGTGLFASLAQVETDIIIRCNPDVDSRCPTEEP